MKTTTFQEVLSECSPSDAAMQVLAAASDETIHPQTLFAEFDVSGGVMVGYGKPNTWIRFDSPPGVIRLVIEAMKSAEAVTPEDMEAFDRWRGEVGRTLVESHGDNLSEIIRQRVLGGADAGTVPLDRMQVTDVDISDLPEDDCVLIVKKAAPAGEETHPVSEDIFSERARTGETADEVVARRKAEGDHRYRWVTGVESRKHFFEVSVSLSVDYSFRPMEE